MGVLQCGILVVGEVVLHELREQLRLDEREHSQLYVKDVVGQKR